MSVMQTHKVANIHRSFHSNQAELMCTDLWVQIITSTADAHGCSAEIDWMKEAHPYYPPTVNDAALAAFVKDVGKRYALLPMSNTPVLHLMQTCDRQWYQHYLLLTHA